MAGHGTRVAQTEIDVVETVDIGEVASASSVEEERERAGPAGHPGHGHAAEQVGLGLFGQHRRVGVGGDEALLFFCVFRPKKLSINHEYQYSRSNHSLSRGRVSY